MVTVLSAAFLVAGLLASGAAGVDPTPWDWRVELAAAVMLIAPVFSRALLHFGFLFVDRIPKAFLPLTAVALATVVDLLSGLAFQDPVLSALTKLAMIGLREFIDHFFTQPLGLKNVASMPDPARPRFLMKKAA